MASPEFIEEKGEKTTVISSVPSDSIPCETESGEFDTAPPPPPSGILARLRRYEALLDDKLGVETNGPARILPEDRNPPNQAIMALMWASGTMNLSCFATGFLGWEFGLDLKQSILTVIFGTLLGSMVTGWCATLGPGTGLRQVAITRYSFGWWPSKIIAALNVIEQLGWSSVGSITGGLALSAVSDGRVSLVLGVIIVAILGLIFSFIGLRAVLWYESWAWAIFFVIFMIMYGEAASFADVKTPSALEGQTLSGTVMSLLAIVYGSSASWSSIVSDYYVHYPVNTSKTKVFLLTTMGITIPTCIGMVIGCCVGSTMGVNTVWANAYDDGLGYLIQTILFPRGFAKFLLVVLVLSGIGINCIAIYSAALSIQLFARPLQVVPRAFWTLIIFVGILLLGVAGRNHLLAVLQNFLSLLGYWNTAFFVILFTEHYLFRKGNLGNYNLEVWNTESKMPIGIAGLIAFLLGIVGCVLGMVQTWYVGIIATMIGESGGDIGNQLAFAFTLISPYNLRENLITFILRKPQSLEQAMAPSFLTLPSELRLQIYRYLLCHSAEIKPQNPFPSDHWSEIDRAAEAFPLKSAILRTCSTIYSEAMPVLYGENTFLFASWSSKFNIDGYRKTGLADENLKLMKNLKLEIQGDYCYEEVALESAVDTFQYIVKQGGDFGTFELVLHMLGLIGDDVGCKRALLTMVAASQEFMTELVALNISKTLTISIWYHHAYEHEFQTSSGDEVQDEFQHLMNQLSFEKKMTPKKQEPELIKQRIIKSEVNSNYDV